MTMDHNLTVLNSENLPLCGNSNTKHRHLYIRKAMGKSNKQLKPQKQLMRKARHDQKDPYLAILDFRNTPTQGFNTSLAQRLMNRRTNTVTNKTKFIATEHRFSISCAQRNATAATETTILLQSRNYEFTTVEEWRCRCNSTLNSN